MYQRFFNIISFLFLSVSCSNNAKQPEAQVSVQNNLYAEEYRPQFHFSPEFGWMNDPNGMVYYDSEYHLFYQYYPDSTVWGPMHWGHAISTDLVHWENLPIALYPDSLGYIFSGSAVVDWKNTSGFGTEANPPLIAIYTIHNVELEKAGAINVESQGIAYSLDKGRSWTKYDENPVIPNDGNRDFRDPNVIWNEAIQKWNLVLSAHDHVQIYSSENLKNWQLESSFGSDAGEHGGVWECPDLFPLKVEGSDETKWVLIVNINPGGPNGGSGTQYFVGDFDGHQFKADSKETSWIDYGRDNYAGVTWSDVPKEDGRRIFLGWMSNWAYATAVPTEVWRSAMTIPRELQLSKNGDRIFIRSVPVKELGLIASLQAQVQIEPMQVAAEEVLDTKGIVLNRSHLSFEFNLSDDTADSLGVCLENDLGEFVRIGYSNLNKQIFVDRTQSGDMSFSEHFLGVDTAPYEAGEQLKLEIFVDAASVEIFVDGGDLVMTEIFFTTSNFTKLKVFSATGNAELSKASLVQLNNIW